MARYDRTVEWNKGGIQKYKILGSPDIYAVQYYDSGHIITTAKTPINNDIRQMDSEGKFGMPKKKELRQLM